MSEKKYIELEAAIEAIKSLYPSVPLVKLNIDKWHEKNKAYMECEMAIEALPAADVRPVARGKWKRVVDFTGVEAFGFKETVVVGWGCNVCGYEVDVSEGSFNFCPNCGARMEEQNG